MPVEHEENKIIQQLVAIINKLLLVIADYIDHVACYF